MKTKRVTALILAVFLLLVLCAPALADFGGFADGGDSGGGNDNFYNDNDGNNGETDGRHARLVILILTGCYFLPYVIVELVDYRSIRQFLQTDLTDSFPDGRLLKAQIEVLFRLMQQSWTDRNIEPVEPYFEKTRYDIFNGQLKALQTYPKNEIRAIYSIRITKAGKKPVVKILAEMVAYHEDGQGKIVKGNTTPKLMLYKFVLTKEKDWVPCFTLAGETFQWLVKEYDGSKVFIPSLFGKTRKGIESICPKEPK